MFLGEVADVELSVWVLYSHY